MELLLLVTRLPGKARLEHALPLIANQLNGRRSACLFRLPASRKHGTSTPDKTAGVLCAVGILNV